MVADTHHRVLLWVSLTVQKTFQLEISSLSALSFWGQVGLFCFVLFGDGAPCRPGCRVTRRVDQADLEGIEMGVRLSTGSALALGLVFGFPPFVLKELALP